jgi:hypothetical protein
MRMLDSTDGIPRRSSRFRVLGWIMVITWICGGAEGSERSTLARPIQVTAGRADFDVVSTRPDSKTLVIVSALSRHPGPFPISLRAGKALHGAARPLPIVTDPSRTPGDPGVPIVPISPPTSNTPVWPSRIFHLLVRDGDVTSAGNYLAVEGRLAAVGTRVRIYVDSKEFGQVDSTTLREIVTTFDDRVYPLAASRFGAAEDVDGDGKFTIFLSGWLDRLAGGRIKVDGFVRGADFDRNLETPFSNRCDMMYLSTSLRAGPHLRTVLAHEYTHAVRFSRKAFPRDRNGHLRPEEEGWLDESLAHLVEDLHGFSRTNLDYRVSAFLSRPESYRLVVEDYYTADLFRSHGNRGGTYLFLRWCVDRHGEVVLDRMIRSPLRGVENLEAATGQSFASLYREWTTSLFLSGLDPTVDRSEPDRYRSIDPRGMIEDWILAGPRSVRVKPGGAPDTWDAVGTSTHYAVIDSSFTGAVRVEVVGPTEAELQVTTVPLPAGLGCLDLDVRPTAGSDGEIRVRARIDSRSETPVRLGAIAWEPLIPASDARSSPFRKSALDMLGIARQFGTSALAPGAGLSSQPIRLDGVRRGDGPLVFKVVGTDSGGRRVAAWAEVNLDPGVASENDDESTSR